VTSNIVGQGFSGSPVFYPDDPDWFIVGMFMADLRGRNTAYVIPIETLTEKFDKEQALFNPSENNIVSTLEKGNEYFQREDYNSSIEYYDKVINDPNFAFAWSNKGKALSSLGKNEEALKCYDRSLEINPNSTFGWSNKGLALYYLGKTEQAIECYSKALEFDSNYAFAWTDEGEAFYVLGKFQQALKCLDKALEISPNHPKTGSCKGMVLHRLGKPEEAEVF